MLIDQVSWNIQSIEINPDSASWSNKKKHYKLKTLHLVSSE